MTPISNHNAFYGRYITKKDKVVPVSISREIEHSYMKESLCHSLANGEIERAHRELDILGIPKNQKNTPQFSLSLAGRIRQVKNISTVK